MLDHYRTLDECIIANSLTETAFVSVGNTL